MGLSIKITNMTSPNGNEVPNQFELTLPTGRIFQSYNSLCAGKVSRMDQTRACKAAKYQYPNWDGVVLGPHWDYSKTTGKYRNQFLGERRAETDEKIRLGIVIVVDDITPFFVEG